MAPGSVRSLGPCTSAACSCFTTASRRDLLAHAHPAHSFLLLPAPQLGKWTDGQTECLVVLVGKLGEGNWAKICADPYAKHEIPERNQVCGGIRVILFLFRVTVLLRRAVRPVRDPGAQPGGQAWLQ